ncbi:AraC family transcriptional regulator [uncultured Ruegeria sp.]|uniref:AraC family transcriptional regulator n=1 Tax=uncultured Ruegeria sp. TaxID=259304 RepID=UPI00261632AD|nr:AraC family transcriptional regulator [uncultured Ruegeria sp.]
MSRSVDTFVIRAGAFHGPAAILAGETGRFERTLRSLQLPSDAEATIDASTYVKGMSEIVRMAGNENFFVQAGLDQDIAELGVFGRAIVSADTLWEALQTASSALKYYQSDSELLIRTYKGRCRIWYFNPFGAKDAKQDIQYTISLLAKIVFLARIKSDPEIQIAYPGASAAHFRNNRYANSIRNSTQGYLEFNDDLLKAKMLRTDIVRAEVLTRYLDDKKIDPSVLSKKAELVAGLVRSSFGIAPWSIVDTCRALGIGQRSLQIQLKDEGTSFRQILRNERHNEARRMLALGASIDETADAIGFGHRQSFSEAFTDWEGCPPSAYAKPRRGG